MKKTGEILKKAREEKQLSIHEIGLSLKINSKILKAIEDGDIDALPAKTFLRGFVQSYAQYLKLNVDDVLRLFTSEMGTTKPHSISLHLGTDKVPPVTVNPAPPTSAPTADAPQNFSAPAREPAPSAHEPKPVTITSEKRFRNMTLIASVIVLITLILITKRVIDRYQNEAVTPEPETIAVTPAVTPQPSTPPVESAPVSSDPAVAQQQAVPPESAPSTETTAPKEGSTLAAPTSPFVNPATTGPAPRSALTTPPTPPPMSTAAPPTTSPTPSSPSTSTTALPAEPAKPTVTEKPEVKPTETPAVAAEVKPAIKNIELIIEALDNVDVEYSTASGKNEKFHLEPEQLHTIKTRSGVKLNVSNGGAISIIVNGKEIGIPGVLGKPIKLTY